MAAEILAAHLLGVVEMCSLFQLPAQLSVLLLQHHFRRSLRAMSKDKLPSEVTFGQTTEK